MRSLTVSLLSRLSRWSRLAFVRSVAIAPLAVFLAVSAGVLASSACDVPSLEHPSDPPRRVPQLPPCARDGDCRDNEKCVDEHCHVTCADDSACNETRPQCDTAAGVCVRCLADGDCAQGQVCHSGECFDDTPATSCTPNDIGCVDDHTAFVCNADGTSETPAPCRDDQVCIAGACHALLCAPATATCNGNSLVSCDSTGTQTTVTSCGDACDSALGCSCSAGACVQRTCEPSSARCVGNSAQRCDGQGLAFGDLEDCGANSCVAGRCLADQCPPGATFCSGRTLLTCNSDGVGFAEQSCAEACSGADGTAACTNQVCQPLSQSCVDVDTVRLCNANGTASTDVACGQNKSCADGVCQDAACVPDCGGVTCGPDPVCGTSCGVCPPVQGPVLTVELSWTPTTEDLDLYVSRAPAATTMCDADTCDFSTCRAGNAARPDWDGNGTASDGDPVLDVADVSHDNPERVLVTIPDGAARSFRVGADNFGGVDGGTATSATATIRVKLDGVVIATHARSVASGAQWRGVVLSWNGATLASDDDGSVDSPFSCTAAAPSCTSDADCADHQACVGDFFGFNGTCQAVQCKANADCVGNANGSQCSGGHNCVAAGSTKGWKQQCANADECSVGFHCDALLNTCEEACSPTQCSAPSTPGCCTVTGGDHCTADTLFGISGNCAP